MYIREDSPPPKNRRNNDMKRFYLMLFVGLIFCISCAHKKISLSDLPVSKLRSVTLKYDTLQSPRWKIEVCTKGCLSDICIMSEGEELNEILNSAKLELQSWEDKK